MRGNRYSGNALSSGASLQRQALGYDAKSFRVSADRHMRSRYLGGDAGRLIGRAALPCDETIVPREYRRGWHGQGQGKPMQIDRGAVEPSAYAEQRLDRARGWQSEGTHESDDTADVLWAIVGEITSQQASQADSNDTHGPAFEV